MLYRAVYCGALGCVTLLLSFAIPVRAAADLFAPHYDIPRLNNITIDGKPDDWGERGFRVEVLAPVSGQVSAAAGHEGRFRLGWSEEGLLVLAQVRDDVFTEATNSNTLWEKDSLEMFVGVKHGERNWMQILVAPGIDPKTPDIRHHFGDRRESKDLRSVTPTVKLARTRTADGYIMEALIPWSNLKVEPKEGRETAFQFALNDADDGDSPRRKSIWFPEDGTYMDPAKMYRIRLAAKPSAPVRAAVLADNRRFPRTRLLVVSGMEQAGKRVEVRTSGKEVVAQGVLTARQGWATASVSLAFPARDRSVPQYAVFLNREAAAPVVLGDIPSLRRDAFARAEVRFEPFVFSGTSFPMVEFAEPEVVEALIGPYTLQTTYYDADRKPVTVASKPGRYGAVVEVRTKEGQTYKCFQTLYRQPQQVDWRRVPHAGGTLNLPAGLGIDPTVVAEQKEMVSALIRSMLAEAIAEQGPVASFLAGLSEIKPGDPPVRRFGPPERDRRWWTLLKKETGTLKQYGYETSLPKGYEVDKEKRWPLMLFLHGSGERGDDLKMVSVHGPLKEVQAGRDLPFIIVAPQCPLGEGWNPTQLGLLLDEVATKYRVDPARVYVTGLSMGGFGTWALAAEFPGRFAAIAPICGGGDPLEGPRIKGIPTWVFHGARDTTVPLRASEEMVSAMQQGGASAVTFTIYPEAGHDSWTASYANNDLYTWFLRQRRP